MSELQIATPWWLLPPGRMHPLWWVAIGAALFWLDDRTGLYTQFPVVYIIPVAVAAWYSGRWPALALAVAIPLAHFTLIETLWQQPGNLAALVARVSFRGTVIIVMALWFARLAEHERELSHRVRVLEGLLSICAYCKSIRNDAGEWERPDVFFSRRSDVQFSHAYCPRCLAAHHPGVVDGEGRPL